MPYDVKNFEEEVIRRSQAIPVLVDFWAEWCGPCRVLSPVLERLARQSNGRWALAKVNTEEFPDVASEYRIQSIPNVKLISDGRVVGEFVGALPEQAIKQWLANNLPDKYAGELANAKSLIETGRSQEAIRLLESVLKDEPNHIEARILFAKTHVFSAPETAFRMVEDIDDPRHIETVEALKTLARLVGLTPDSLPDSPSRDKYRAAAKEVKEQNFDEALRQLVEMIRNDRYYDDDGSRKACIAIFRFLGEEHPVTRKYRREFSSALY
jgi:putative thioredoxin